MVLAWQDVRSAASVIRCAHSTADTLEHDEHVHEVSTVFNCAGDSTANTQPIQLKTSNAMDLDNSVNSACNCVCCTLN